MEQKLLDLIRDKKALVLTIDLAIKLKGKKIAAHYFGYDGQNGYFELVIGDITTEYEIYKANIDKMCAKGDMQKKKVAQNKYLLLDADGNNTWFFCDKNYPYYEETGIFCCSDLDRFVHFMVIE